ncbi:unnamed protein product [Nippostrongylus brasiliensis]|uniref:Reverse transcriptase domain-containing protein n=1 Tax=Nippostrongylus brasiliensis TaxID=27835 RepID=A0A0N4YDH5_NIPBR|nr:unnamed protein product [Nippostrongylus brasiliensis]
MSVRMETKEGYWTLISIYPPQNGCPEKDKDEFYEALDDFIRSDPDDDFLTIARDLNGHVGTGRRGLERVHERRGVGAKNEDGERIPDLAVAWQSAARSLPRESQNMTYCSEGRRTEVDHILVRRQDLKAVKDVKVLRGEDVATQRRPPVADLSVLLPPKMKERTEPKIRWWACGWTRLDRVRSEDMTAVMGTAPVHLKMREQKLRRLAEMRMLRWACGWTRLDRVRSEDMTAVMGTAPVHLKMREQKLRSTPEWNLKELSRAILRELVSGLLYLLIIIHEANGVRCAKDMKGRYQDMENAVCVVRVTKNCRKTAIRFGIISKSAVTPKENCPMWLNPLNPVELEQVDKVEEEEDQMEGVAEDQMEGVAEDQMEGVAEEDQMEMAEDQMEMEEDQMETAEDQMEMAEDQMEGVAEEDQMEMAEDQMEMAEDQMEMAEDQMEGVAEEDQMEMAEDQMEMAEDQMETAEDQMETAEDQMEMEEDQMEGVAEEDQMEMEEDQTERVAEEDEMAMAEDEMEMEEEAAERVAEEEEMETEAEETVMVEEEMEMAVEEDEEEMEMAAEEEKVEKVVEEEKMEMAAE